MASVHKRSRMGIEPCVGSERLPRGAQKRVKDCTNQEFVSAFNAAEKDLAKAKRSNDRGDVTAALLRRAKAFKLIDPDFEVPTDLNQANIQADGAANRNVDLVDASVQPRAELGANDGAEQGLAAGVASGSGVAPELGAASADDESDFSQADEAVQPPAKLGDSVRGLEKTMPLDITEEIEKLGRKPWNWKIKEHRHSIHFGLSDISKSWELPKGSTKFPDLQGKLLDFFKGLVPDAKFSSMVVNRHRQGMHMGRHNDQNMQEFPMQILCVWGEYAGGELKVYGETPVLIDKPGIYYINGNIDHEVFPIQSGVRYSIVTYCKHHISEAPPEKLDELQALGYPLPDTTSSSSKFGWLAETRMCTPLQERDIIEESVVCLRFDGTLFHGVTLEMCLHWVKTLDSIQRADVFLPVQGVGLWLPVPPISLPPGATICHFNACHFMYLYAAYEFQMGSMPFASCVKVMAHHAPPRVTGNTFAKRKVDQLSSAAY
jgi:hypothetical protein